MRLLAQTLQAVRGPVTRVMGAEADRFFIGERRRVAFALNFHQLSDVKPGETRVGGLTEASGVLLLRHARQKVRGSPFVGIGIGGGRRAFPAALVCESLGQSRR